MNLVTGCLEVYRDPGAGMYRTTFEVDPDGAVEPLARTGERIAVGDLLP